MRSQVPDEVVTPFTPMLMRVELGERAYLADVGFGSRSLYSPLALEFDTAQTGSLEPRRLVRRGPLIVQQTPVDGTWADVYQFTLDEAPAIDFELGNWFTSTHPPSRFKLNLALALADEDRRYAILNREFITRHADGRVEKRELATPDELLEVLAQHFDLHFPPGTRFGPPGAPWPS